MAGGVVVAAPVVVRLALLVAVLTVVATTAGLWWPPVEGPATIVSVHRETVELAGEGLYRHDTVFKGAGNQGTDVVALLIGVPLLVGATVHYRRGSLPAALLLTGAFGWTLYLYATMAVGTAHNELFLLYVALFAASLHGFIAALRGFDSDALTERLGRRLPRRSLTAFLVASGTFTLLMWGGMEVAALLTRRPPELLGHATTAVTEALDLAVIVPAAFAAAAALRRRRLGLGVLMSVPILVIIVVLAAAIPAQTVSQLAAGITFTAAEIAGPTIGFVVLGLVAGVLLARILRAASTIPDTAR